MRLVRSACYCLWTLHIASTLNFIPELHIMNQRIKRNTGDKFSVLLNLYKMNPLRHSKVFEMFSNKILLPNRADRDSGIDAMHFDENESIREKQMRADVNLKRIQDAIHASPSPRRRIGRPEFVDDSIVPEKFSNELKLNDLVKLNLLKPEQDAFKDIFGHIESRETTDGIPVTDQFETIHPTSVTVSQPADFENNHDFKVKYADEGVVIMR